MIILNRLLLNIQFIDFNFYQVVRFYATYVTLIQLNKRFFKQILLKNESDLVRYLKKIVLVVKLKQKKYLSRDNSS